MWSFISSLSQLVDATSPAGFVVEDHMFRLVGIHFEVPFSEKRGEKTPDAYFVVYEVLVVGVCSPYRWYGYKGTKFTGDCFKLDSK